jgi:hypothetical protein
MYTGLSVCFTGPIGYAIGGIGGTEQWRYFFWITGAMTCVWAIVVGVFLPDNPVKAKFISEREKAIAIDRVRADQTGIENKTWKKEQMIEAFTDPKTWLMFLFNIWISIPNGGLTNVSSTDLFNLYSTLINAVRSFDYQRARIHSATFDSAHNANWNHANYVKLHLQRGGISMCEISFRLPDPRRLGNIWMYHWHDQRCILVHTSVVEFAWQAGSSLYVILLSWSLHCYPRDEHGKYCVRFPRPLPRRLC